MNTALIIAAVVLAIAVGCGAIAWTVARRHRTGSLRKHFGPEYDAALQRFGTRYQAEKELATRLDERTGVPVRHLRPEEKEQFAARWHEIQAHFVEDPVTAVRDADSLISETMRVRGYPTGAFEVRDENVLVDYPRLVRNYREAHRIAISTREGEASLEDLRRAIVYYRALFEELLEEQGVH